MTTKIILVCILISFVSCVQNYTPLPTGYFRIEIPKNKYQNSKIECPFTFNYSLLAKMVTNKNFCWFNIHYSNLNAKIHCTYKPVKNNLHSLLEDSHSLVYNHIVAADAIKEIAYINKEANVGGILYKLQGNSATPIQFFITDSIKHFLRGALYFNNEPNADSLKPVVEYIEQDIRELIHSLKWKESI